MQPKAIPLVFAALAVLVSGCGESGVRESRPIEVIFFVGGPTGARFRVDALQAANADHRFGDRVFEAPHFFVLENVRQPVSGIFQALDEPIRVTLALGSPTSSLGQEGQSRTIEPGQSDNSVGTGTPAPDPRGVEARFEVTSTGTVGFTAILGDQNATNLTSCVLPSEIAQNCLTPATFFLENPQKTVSAVFTKLATENPDARLDVNLFLDDRLAETESAKGDVVIAHDL